ncbi:MAG: GNAT family N-acetyltransferase [Alphaproteobacteria bacterium]|nr:GNAT family N-acetyltransferase [Alphaproteobacteria bacterium]
MIRSVTPDDAATLCSLYNHYIEHSIVTFEEEPVSVEAFRDRIENITESCPWLVYEADDDIAGYVYASPWKARHAYRYAAESTVYMAPNQGGKGIGTALYERLIADLKAQSVHSVMAGIALPNDASVALHEKVGFEKVAHFKEVGWKFNRWIDVAYWELMLE